MYQEYPAHLPYLQVAQPNNNNIGIYIKIYVNYSKLTDTQCNSSLNKDIANPAKPGCVDQDFFFYDTFNLLCLVTLKKGGNLL